MWVSIKDRLPKENGRYKIRDIKGHEEYTLFISNFQSFFYDKRIKEWFEEDSEYENNIKGAYKSK